MRYNLQKRLSKLEKQRRFLWQWRRVLTVCAAVVVFWTTYAMILPAITWEKMQICEMQEHTHDESCYGVETDESGEEKPVLICSLPEHTHTDSCYDAPPAPPVNYLCGKEVHTHEADCFFSDGSVSCTMEEHSHTDACLMAQKQTEEPEEDKDPEENEAEETPAEPEYFCGLTAHAHSEDACYAPDGTLSCALPEHIHDENCLVPPIREPETPEYFCGQEEHTHQADCYDAEGQIICLLEEHTHTEACLTEPAETPVYLCGLEEHTHQADCYDAEGQLLCLLEAHTHTEACLTEPEEVPEYFCGLEEHIHQADCYDAEGQLVCPLEEHIHTEDCLEPPFFMPMLFSLETPDSHFALPSMVTAAPQANEWQAVVGRYTGNTGADSRIIQDTDGNIMRIRKNVIPAGTENEFYIYLSVEPVFYHQWVEIFKGSGMLVNNANNERTDLSSLGFSNDMPIRDVIIALTGTANGMQGHSSLLVPIEGKWTENGRLTSTYTTQVGDDIYISTIQLMRSENDTNPIVINNAGLVFSISQNSNASFTIIYSAPNSNSSVKLSNIQWDGNGRVDKKTGTTDTPGMLIFPPEAYNALIASNSNVFDQIRQRSFPQMVTDPMGAHIEYLGLPEKDGGKDYTYPGVVNFDESTNTLYWDLSGASVEQSQSSEDYEQISTDDAFSRKGAFQLVYKVRLRVEDEGFNSAAAQLTAQSGSTVYPTNGDTTVTYHTDTHPGDTRTAHFDVPAVRGLLYDVSFRKLDQYAQAVPGAQFTLTNDAGETVDTITTSTNQIYSFSGLPWGIYHLTETLPDSYSAESGSMVTTQSWTIPLCYTTNPGVLVPDTGQLVGNMVYNGGESIPFEQGALKILNYKFTREFQFRKINPEQAPLMGAEFKLFTDEALTQEADVTFRKTDLNGIFTNADFILPEGTYYLVETVTPVGYLRPVRPGVLTVYPGRNGFRIFWNGKTYESTETIEGYHTEYSVDLVNEHSVPLPATGGRGMAPVVVSGILVLTLTWSYYFVHCKKKAGDKSAG